MTSKSYTLHIEDNQVRGLDAATLLLVLDSNNICVDDRHISRDCFDTIKQYKQAIKDAETELRDQWPIYKKGQP